MAPGHRFLVSSLMLLVLLPGCGGSETAGPVLGSPSDLDLSPRPDEEAEWAAVWLSGALAAPDDLYREIQRDLAAIRTAFRETLPLVDSLHFHPTWSPDIRIEFLPAVREEIERGVYRDWDVLNSRFQLAEIDSVSRVPGSFCMTFSFTKRLHPLTLTQHYLELRGVSWVSYMPTGVYSTVFPLRAGGRRIYLFRNCIGLCAEREYWFFRVSEDGPEFAGYYDGSGEEPAWWDEVERGLLAVGTGG